MAILRTLAAGAAAVMVLSACSGASSGDGRSNFEREGDHATGNPNAPVTMVEYASVACGGCAAWHASAKPTVDRYIESGDVRYVFREMITGQPNLAIAGFMLANCAPEDQYFDVIDLLFEQQRALFSAMQQGRAQAQFQTIARTAGFSDEDYRACMENEDNLQAVRDANERASSEGIGATPTFIVNGQRLEAGSSPDADGPVYTAEGQPLVDEQGPIPATFEGETFERIILYYKNRAEGSASAEDGGAE
jgi:predicted DsbA family dithiol-disulfide isomerase